MKKFYDKTTNLEWLLFSAEESKYDPEFLHNIKTINEWSSHPLMKRFISKSSKIGDLLNEFFQLLSNMDLYFIKRDGVLVGATLIAKETHIAKVTELKDYIINKKYNNIPLEDFKIDNEQFLNLPDVFKILKNSKKSNLYIEYLLVAPEYHGKGIGTSISTSIKNNIGFFEDINKVGIIQAAIDNENIGSRKALLKNGFKKMLPCETSQSYSTYYFTPRKIQNSKDIIHEKL